MIVIRLLIVDDEAQIRNGLIATVDWASIGITETLAARNGIEAMKLIQKSPPEIVLTDIRMPGMDGLELSIQVKSTFPDTRILLLSGYTDFNYARQAISIGIEEYFVKPVNIEELTTKVKSLVRDIQSRRLFDDSGSRDISLVRGNVISNILRTSDSMHIEKQETLKELCPEFKDDTLVCLLVELDNYDNLVKEYSYSKISELKVLLENRTLSALNCSFPSILYKPQESRQAAFFINSVNESIQTGFKDAVTSLEYQFDGFLNQYQATVTIAVGKIFNRLDFKGAYEDARNTLNYKFFLGRGMTLFSDNIKHGVPNSLITPYEYEDSITGYIKNDNVSGLMTEMQQLFDNCRFSCPSQIDAIKEYLFELVRMIARIVKHSSWTKPQSISSKRTYLQIPGSLETLEDYFQWIENFIYEYIEEFDQNQPVKNIRFIEKAKKYINENLSKDISIQDAADHVERNPNYFCHAFKKYTGYSFTEYLNKIRIDKAKELLATTSYMTYEISDRVGFYNYRYFTQVFKKLTEKTPTQYRNEQIEGNN